MRCLQHTIHLSDSLMLLMIVSF
uniref:Uncharacterized protein n=1 Tax=Anguilla anguilla TaxID=7936 RepID=A0A0E9W387_ANGAN